jgi:cobalt-zinc-cadmium resistance protein CzcA
MSRGPLKDKVNAIRESLPPGVKLQTVYDRTELIDHVIHTVQKNLFEGGLLVVAVLFVFLGNLRAGIIVAMAIPLSMLFAFFSGMLKFGIAASLLSLGAIDFGLVVDSSVVMIENCVRHLAHNRDGRSRLQIIRDAAIEVRKPTMFGELIIMIVYLADPNFGRSRRQAVSPYGYDSHFGIGWFDGVVADVDAGVGESCSCRKRSKKKNRC